MKRSRQAAGGFVKRQRVNPVGVLLNRLTRLPIEILNQILRMAAIGWRRPEIGYNPNGTDNFTYYIIGGRAGGWAGTERNRLTNWLWTRFVTWNPGDYGDYDLYDFEDYYPGY